MTRPDFILPARLPQRPVAAVVRLRQRGYVMVVSMLIILLITVMSISMAKTFFLEERMAGSLREKSRSFAAAQAALRYGESFVRLHPGNVGVTCPASGQLPSPVCNNAMPTPNTSGSGTQLFPAYYPSQTPPSALGITVSATAPSADSFWSLPGIYIYYVGPTTGGYLYQVYAYGYGGTQLSVSQVQSTVQVTCSNKSPVEHTSPCG